MQTHPPPSNPNTNASPPTRCHPPLRGLPLPPPARSHHGNQEQAKTAGYGTVRASWPPPTPRTPEEAHLTFRTRPFLSSPYPPRRSRAAGATEQQERGGVERAQFHSDRRALPRTSGKKQAQTKQKREEEEKNPNGTKETRRRADRGAEPLGRTDDPGTQAQRGPPHSPSRLAAPSSGSSSSVPGKLQHRSRLDPTYSQLSCF
ncbi:uncharacterized protein LOC114811185 isoform X2 [Ornithorhynchus anatinus]|nr:uncharacterized protein LOC114811185 isoform X2 [Ornithorhynchus anatinus]